MVKLLEVLVVVLCLQAILAAKTCSGSNIFLKKLVEAGKIKLRLAPTKMNDCGTEWSTYGSCCTLSSARKYALKDKNLLRNSTKIVNTSLALQRYLMTSLMPDLEFWLASDESLAKTQKSLPKLKEDLEQLGKVDPMVHRQCWIDEMSKLRSASLCSTCSARGRMFFHGGRALVSLNSCTRMLENCYDSINEIVKSMRTAHAFYKVMENFSNEDKFDFAFHNETEEIKDDLRVLGRSKISSDLRHYSNSTKGTKRRIKFTKVLCKDFMMLNKRPFIMQVLFIMTRLTRALVNMNRVSNSVNTQIKMMQYADKKNEILESKKINAEKKATLLENLKIFEERIQRYNKNQNELFKYRLNQHKSLVSGVIWTYENNWKVTSANNTTQNHSVPVNKSSANSETPRKLALASPLEEHSKLSFAAEVLIIDEEIHADSKQELISSLAASDKFLQPSDATHDSHDKTHGKQDVSVTSKTYTAIPMNLTLTFP
jgi:hypothetical protein